MKTRNITLVITALLAATPVSALAMPAGMDTGRMVQRIEKADLNHDGMITRKEFTDYRGQQFSQFDRNKDGYLSADDLPSFARQSERGKQFTAMIDAFDLNHDGRVNRTEFVNGPTPAFDQADADGNGVIDAYELKQIKARG